MPHARLSAHEFLHLQEHIRTEAAAAASYRQMVNQCQDPELKRFVEAQAQTAEGLVQQLSGFLQS